MLVEEDVWKRSNVEFVENYLIQILNLSCFCLLFGLARPTI